ncbi:MAG: translation initiation factor IF-2 [Candidatus Babeliales bacterium]
MRVHEISKQLNVGSKELIDALLGHGFEVQSHMSVLSAEAVKFLQKQFGSKEKKAPISKIKAKEPVQAPVLIVEAMSVGQFAQITHIPANEIIIHLLRSGRMYTMNQVVDAELVKELADHFGIETISSKQSKEVPKEKEEVVLKNVGGAEKRMPVVVVIGHVDHGKTTLLDYIRKTRVVAREKGGITQHIGAYKAHTKHGDIVFLDTPGHAAFSQIRSRGVKVADIAILVVAADDSVKPQTVEAIKHAKSAEIPIIVAVNKIDKAQPAQIERVKQDLAQYELLPEDWGGQVVVVPISAKVGTGIDQLLEMILLQADVMELTADVNKTASGIVLESMLEKGRGVVATVLCHQGTLKVGDHFSAGKTTGKVNSMVDSFGKRVMKIGPSEPVRISGFEQLPDAGDYFEVVSKDKLRDLKTDVSTKAFVPKKVDEDAFHIIIKTDTNSTKEALIGALEKLSKKGDKSFNIVHAAVGNINESDISLAANTGAVIYGLHVKVEPSAAVLARKDKLAIRLFDIIYKLLEEIEVHVKAPVVVATEIKKIGEATVLRVFDIKNIGVIAGCIVNEGTIANNGTVKVRRGRQVVGEGKIKSLQRDRKTVKEVHSGYECGFLVEGFDGFQVDDRVECYLEKPIS